MKPGTFSFAVGRASGFVSVVVSVQVRLLYVAPPSVETWAKRKSQPSSWFQRASNVSVAPAPLGTGIDLTIASSRLFAAPEKSAGSPGVSGGLAATLHCTGRGGEGSSHPGTTANRSGRR